MDEDKLIEVAERKTAHFLNEHFVNTWQSEKTADQLRNEFEDEYNLAMDLFISGYRFAKGLPDLGEIDLLNL